MTVTQTTHKEMIEALGLDKATACKELGMTAREYNQAIKYVGKMPVSSLMILCDLYNEKFKPAEPVQLQDFETLLK